ncbi:MAG: outer membrane protein assembly factor BamB family protein [Planctomycetota bacterium]|jgi:outer membrane protein assembly factor BamB
MEQKNFTVKNKFRPVFCRVLIFIFLLSSLCRGEDWATYRYCNRRSGISSEALGQQLFLQWKYIPAHPPKAAWPQPAEELPRMHSDRAYHTATAGNNIYFGSSVTDMLYCLNAATGKIRWSFFAEGPIRFAPTVYNGKVYFGSDDGCVYCVDAKKGGLVWKYRAGPSDEKVIGNGRMISLWPVRTGVVVDDGIVYFGVGVFPYEGIYICALGAADGSVIWKNDSIGERGHELDYSGISPHGYPLVSEDILYIPSGRSMPAAFDKKSGRFLFYASCGGKTGGAWALLEGEQLIAGVDTAHGISGSPAKIAYDARKGSRRGDAFGWFNGIDMVVTGEFAFNVTREGIYAVERARHSKGIERAEELRQKRRKLAKELSSLRDNLKEPDEKSSEETDREIEDITSRISEMVALEEERLKETSYKWHYERKGLVSVIMAGDYLIAGGDGEIVCIDVRNGDELWRGQISGKGVGLAAANGRLIVSTDRGYIYCFGKKEKALPAEVVEMRMYGTTFSELDQVYSTAAEEIVKNSQIKKGYCLVLDCGEGRLAEELARRTKLKIVGIEKDTKKLAAARGRLRSGGFLGRRVVVEPWELSSLPSYFANLIVSDGMLLSGKTAASKEAIGRVLRPYGGVYLSGVKRGLSDEISWEKFVRGGLEGAGSWTHQYSNAQNTACSDDREVKGPLGVLWFGEPGPEGMVERHAKAASPVSMNGRLFIQGEEVIKAYDAYNGTFLWERKIPGAFRVRVDVDSGNLALSEDGLYVAAYDKCYRLDPATGETIRIYEIPESEAGRRRWGYIAFEGNILYGSAAEPLKRPYGALWKRFVDGGKWRNTDEIKSQSYEDNSGDEGLDFVIEEIAAYERYVSEYPVPDDRARAAMQRSGALWHPITDFPKWENYSGSAGAVTDRIMVSDKVFAVDAKSGKVLWVHKGRRIANVTLSLGDGKIFFAENGVSNKQKKRALKDKKRFIERGIYQEAEGTNVEYDDADVRTVVCLDAVSGEKIWEKSIDLTGCCGDALGTIYYDEVVLVCGNVGNHDAWRFKEDELKFRRITAMSAEDGEVLWSRPLNYRTRPLIVQGEIIIEPLACELRTGKIKKRTHPITGEEVSWEFLRPGHTCAITSASSSVLFYRSSSTAIYDLERDQGLAIFGAIRPGCWLNAIPASGLMLMPEASSGCTCSYPLRCSFVLVHKPERVQPWTVFITGGQTRNVKEFAINFGAPADMRDDEGELWFGYPNPQTKYLKNHFSNYGVKFDLGERIVEGMGYFYRDYRNCEIEGTDKAWLYTSGCRGLLRCEVSLIDDVNTPEAGTYTVQLGFSALEGDRRGERVFDVKLQGNVVLEKFDILKIARKVNKAIIKEFKGIDVKDKLIVELVPERSNPTIKQAPVINFIKVVREETKTKGLVKS